MGPLPEGILIEASRIMDPCLKGSALQTVEQVINIVAEDSVHDKP